MIETKGQKVFNVANIIFMLFVIAAVVLPLLYIFSASLSSGDAVVSGRVGLLPVEFTFDAYKKVFNDNSIIVGYINTFFYTIVGTTVSMVLSVCGAYPLSKKRLGLGAKINFLIAVTMWFSAGTIPLFLNIKSFGLLNTRTAVILPFAISTFNVIILRTAFASVPAALEEAAYLDGASELNVLAKVYIPLVLPSLFTVWLFYAVDRWNGYFWSMVLLRDENKQPLQVILANLITSLSAKASDKAALYDVTTSYSDITVTYATIVISVIPMLIVYPFIQKFFVKGVTVGAIK